jgi:hypothetical protein
MRADLIDEILKREEVTQENYPTVKDFQIFYHVNRAHLGDYDSFPAPLAGFNILLKYKIMLEQFRDKYPMPLHKKPLEDAIALLEQARLFSLTISSLKTYYSPEDALIIAASALMSKTLQVKPKERGLCPLTLSFSKPQDVLVEYVCEEEGELTLTVYNTGEGLEYHPQKDDRYYPYTIAKIKTSELTRAFFIKVLSSVFSECPIAPSYFYETLASVGTVLREYEGEKVPPYFVGAKTSPLKCYAKWLHRTLPELYYQYFKSQLQRDLASTLTTESIPICKETDASSQLHTLKQIAYLEVNEHLEKYGALISSNRPYFATVE